MKRQTNALFKTTMDGLCDNQLNNWMNPAADFYCPQRDPQFSDRLETVDTRYPHFKKYQND